MEERGWMGGEIVTKKKCSIEEVVLGFGRRIPCHKVLRA
jgi:hypothetical protein